MEIDILMEIDTRNFNLACTDILFYQLNYLRFPL